MNSLAILVVTATLGVDYGWHHTPDGQLEYLIQIEPNLVSSMQDGVDITSELMPEVRGNVRRFRISVGTGALPRETVIQTSAQTPAVKASPAIPPRDSPPREISPPANSSAPKNPLGDPAGNPQANADPRRGLQRPELDNTATTNPRDILPHRQGFEHSEPDKVASNSGQPIEQAAAKPTGDAGSPSDTLANNADQPVFKEVKTANVMPTSTDESTTSPWLVGTIVALCASLGANFYQGVNLKSARRRYYNLVERLGLRAAPGSDGVTIEPL